MDKLTFEQYCNQPAFPNLLATESAHKGGAASVLYTNTNEPGITRLEYFTAAAMQGLLASGQGRDNIEYAACEFAKGTLKKHYGTTNSEQ